MGLLTLNLLDLVGLAGLQLHLDWSELALQSCRLYEEIRSVLVEINISYLNII